MSDHGYTTHGHSLPGKTQHPEHRPRVENCGGPIICKQCRTEVATAMKQMFQTEPPEPDEPQPALSKNTRDALKLLERLGIQEPAPWIEKAAMLAAAGATEAEVTQYVVISSQAAITQDNIHALQAAGIRMIFKD